jgi:hypothetical protein
MTKTEQLGKPVIVTTELRGVFFGYADKTDGDVIELKRARMCVYWSADMKGIMGLADFGPSKDCKISPAADIELRKITAVIHVSLQAVKAWESQPWQK